MIRVVVADDHHLVRQGIRALIEQADDMQVVGEAEDGYAAAEMAGQLKPDVLVLDIAMPQLNGIQAIDRIRSASAGTKVVILSMYSDYVLLQQALQAGARGYLLKDAVTEELLLAIRAANRGATYLSPVVSEKLLGDVLNPHPETESIDPYSVLTPRELEILQLISEGYTNNNIAKMMHISVKTVERHRTNLMAKLGVHNLVELVRYAIKHKLILLDS